MREPLNGIVYPTKIAAVSSIFHIVAGLYHGVRTLAPEHGRNQYDPNEVDLRDTLNADLFFWGLRESKEHSCHALKLFMLYSGYRDLGSLRHAVELDRLAGTLERAFVRR